jgi:protein tyrosine phosphatase
MRSKARHISRLMVQNPERHIPPDYSNLSYYYSVSLGADPLIIKAKQNRYTEIEPYNRTRVALGALPGNESGYLNANWVRERAGGKWWIAAQAPLPTTWYTFLSLLRQPISPPYSSIYDSEARSGNPIPPSPRASKVRTIVQLTRDVERRIRKADPYFPSEIGQYLDILSLPHVAGGESGPPIQVSLVDKPREDIGANCIINTVSVVFPDSERATFNHFLYTAWPDHGVPEESDQRSLVNFVRLVDRETDPDEFVLVHCSAGRVGTPLVCI